MKKLKTFSEWLQDRRSDDTPTGDLARDASRDAFFPVDGSLETYVDHLLRVRASDYTLEALKSAFRTYDRERQKKTGIQ
jgi:hypothetical protein